MKRGGIQNDWVAANLRAALLSGVACTVLAILAPQARAEEFKVGDIDVNVSGAATMGSEIRTAPRDPALIFPANGRRMGVPATAISGPNQDDGNLNYGQGQAVSSVAKAYATIDAHNQNFGVFVTGKIWGDATQLYQDVPWGNYANGYAAGTPLGQMGFDPREKFAGFAIQQAYAYTKQKVEGVSVEGRIGEINVPWGLSTAIPGGLFYAVNAVDYSAVVRPGAQAAELTIPTPGVFTRMGFLQDKAIFESFLLFQGPRSVVAGCGTFFSYADWAAPGCNNVFFNPLFADPTSYRTDYALNRKAAAQPNDINFGAGGTYTADSLLTKFGLYYAHVDQPTPVGNGVKTLRPGPNYWLPSNPGGLNSAYNVAYLGAVDSGTINFTTQIKATTLYGEYVFSPNKPVNYNAADLVYPLVGPQYPTPLRNIYNSVPPGGVFDGYHRLEVGNLGLGVRQILPPILYASTLTLGAEFGLKQVYDLPPGLRFGRSEAFGQGPLPGHLCKGPAVQCTQAGYVTANATGYRLTAELRYDNVLTPGLSVMPAIGLIQDVSGWSYDGVFNQGRMVMPLRVRAEYGKKYFAEVVWAPALQIATYDNTSDRQFVNFSAGIRF
ncbi:DUF1302 family protein [Rhodoblastus sp. 17X3]|uniref:DUF1302 domain-containing protein n=1 Tax=Rhodoblastus sp. 17X3 TaxID=3047026 RepID=UPI0024B7DA5D|nr:DUF1302 family protein [Rhodoblastus sp. 17X3]MDI9847314.1 DUF1302 family protein [Rhodoblastus sp. 17X3]